MHWLDALTPPLEAHLRNLSSTIRVLLSRMPARPAQAAGPAAYEATDARPDTSTGARTDARPDLIPEVRSDASIRSSRLEPTAPLPDPAAEPAHPLKAAPVSGRSRIPVWAWGGIAVLVLALAAVVATHSGLGAHTASKASPAPATNAPQDRGSQAHTLIGQKRFAEALPLAQQACNGGDMYACTDLGLLYEQGQGVAQDYVQARSFFLKACQGGSTYGCNEMGLAYLSGWGVPKDNAQARSWFQKGCDGGNNWSCEELMDVPK